MYILNPLVHVVYILYTCVRVSVYTAPRPEAWARRGRVINNVRLFEINFNEEGDCCDLDKHGVVAVGRACRTAGYTGRTGGRGGPRDFPSAVDAR